MGRTGRDKNVNKQLFIETITKEFHQIISYPPQYVKPQWWIILWQQTIAEMTFLRIMARVDERNFSTMRPKSSKLIFFLGSSEVGDLWVGKSFAQRHDICRHVERNFKQFCRFSFVFTSNHVSSHLLLVFRCFPFNSDQTVTESNLPDFRQLIKNFPMKINNKCCLSCVKAISRYFAIEYLWLLRFA